jgi:hypothetical protein
MTMLDPQEPQRNEPARPAQRTVLSFHPYGVLLLSPLIAAVTIVILLGLLGIFVAWLLIVAVLVSAIVASDLARRSLRLLFKTDSRTFQHRAAGYP